MPYIDKFAREELKHYTADGRLPTTAGELNFILTTTVLEFMKKNYYHVGYTQLNEIMGVLESVKQEFYRRKVVPYEDSKIQENGDVY